MERHERSAFPSLTASKPVALAFNGGRLTSDAGVLVLADVERRLAIAERLERCLTDPRAPERVRHRHRNGMDRPCSRRGKERLGRRRPRRPHP